MKIYIMTDLEGISGIDSLEMIQKGNPRLDYSNRRLMADTNAAIEGAFRGGADEVYVTDGHGGGGNFILELLDERARIPAQSLYKTLDEATDAVMVVGAHAMAGTINGFLDHTQNSMRWFNYYVNGRRTGELGQWGILAGHYNVPVIMVSGDQAACVEARQFFGNIECAVVKYGVGRNKAELVDERKAEELITDAAARSISLVGKIKPYRPILPLDLKLELYRSDYCDEIATDPGIERIDARTVRKVSDSYKDILF
jgi:D-amino peptidase